MCVDLRASGASDLIKLLAAETDVLIENFRPGVMSRLGVGYEELALVNPRLIVLSISGFGLSGPEALRPAYAPVIHAECGLVHRSATRARSSFRDLPISLADTNGGLHGLVAVLAAVHIRERTGIGQHIDIAMFDAMLATDD